MDTLFIFGIAFVIAGFIAWAWVNGIDNMNNDWPDYKGDDFL